jgi:hypothetical protein
MAVTMRMPSRVLTQCPQNCPHVKQHGTYAAATMNLLHNTRTHLAQSLLVLHDVLPCTLLPIELQHRGCHTRQHMPDTP